MKYSKFYYVSRLEGEYLYHMTGWYRLKCILEDKVIKRNPIECGITSQHPEAVSFTTNPFRYLTPVYPMPFFTNDCYIRFPAKSLDAYPVIYPVPEYILEESPILSITLDHEDELRKKFGKLFDLLVYKIEWAVENEFRVFHDVKLTDGAVIFVSDYYKARRAREMTDLEVRVDKRLLNLFRRQREGFKEDLRLKLNILSRELEHDLDYIKQGFKELDKFVFKKVLELDAYRDRAKRYPSLKPYIERADQVLKMLCESFPCWSFNRFWERIRRQVSWQIEPEMLRLFCEDRCRLSSKLQGNSFRE